MSSEKSCSTMGMCGATHSEMGFKGSKKVKIGTKSYLVDSQGNVTTLKGDKVGKLQTSTKGQFVLIGGKRTYLKTDIKLSKRKSRKSKRKSRKSKRKSRKSKRKSRKSKRKSRKSKRKAKRKSKRKSRKSKRKSRKSKRKAKRKSKRKSRKSKRKSRKSKRKAKRKSKKSL